MWVFTRYPFYYFLYYPSGYRGDIWVYLANGNSLFLIATIVSMSLYVADYWKKEFTYKLKSFLHNFDYTILHTKPTMDISLAPIARAH